MKIGELQEWLKLFDEEMEIKLQIWDVEGATGQLVYPIVSIKIDVNENTVLLADNE